MTELSGAVSVVTGAGSGIGRATALALGREGSAVVVADIDGAAAKAVADDIGDAFAAQVDVSDGAQVEELVARSIAWKGHCDVFISNAGIGCVGAPHDFTHEQWRHLVDTNLFSCIWPLRTLIPHMLERGTGHLAFVSSGSGVEAQADRAPYNVAKFAIVGLAESLARYMQGTGVRVSLIVPGAIATDGWKRCVYAGDREGSRDELREVSRNWPKPDVMADTIIRGIQSDRYLIAQDNPYEPEWWRNIHERKGRDPDAFVRS